MRPALRDLLLLTRAPLALTAVADGLTGYLLATVRLARAAVSGAHPDAFPHEPWRARDLALVGAASASLYLGGMALNDYFDRDRDRTLAPNRPIPSGRVSAGLALALGLGLLVLGISVATLAAGGTADAAGRAGPERGGLAAGLVALGVLAYDGLLKRWKLPGAVGMALCRAANVGVGATVGLAVGLGTEGATNLPAKLALATFVYVFSLTLLSTLEDHDAPRPAVLVGFGGALAAPIALVAILPDALRQNAAPFTVAHAVLILVLASRALRLGTKKSGRETTRWLIRGLFLLDGAALAGCGVLDGKIGAILAALFAASVGGAMLLFRPPRAPASPAPRALADAGQL